MDARDDQGWTALVWCGAMGPRKKPWVSLKMAGKCHMNGPFNGIYGDLMGFYSDLFLMAHMLMAFF